MSSNKMDTYVEVQLKPSNNLAVASCVNGVFIATPMPSFLTVTSNDREYERECLLVGYLLVV